MLYSLMWPTDNKMLKHCNKRPLPNLPVVVMYAIYTSGNILFSMIPRKIIIVLTFNPLTLRKSSRKLHDHIQTYFLGNNNNITFASLHLSVG